MVTQQAPQLQLSLAWADADIQELVVYARSEHFSGTTSLYIAPGQLMELADTLSGFPSSRDDQRSFVLGQADLPGYGEVRATMYCRDSTGHIGVHVAIHATAADAVDRPESCTVLLRVVPSDLDRFIEELRRLVAQEQSATLMNAA